MKKMKVLAGFLLTLILALGLTVAAYAYDYEVTVSSGSNGTVKMISTTGESHAHISDRFVRDDRIGGSADRREGSLGDERQQ
jgi:hypothetical protein